MIQGKIFTPPSPPSSPRMSSQDYKPVISSWQDQQESHSGFGRGSSEGAHYQAPDALAHHEQQYQLQPGSLLRSFKTSPFPLNSQYHSHGLLASNYSQQAEPGSATSHPGAQQAFSASVTGSPLSRFSPRSDAVGEHADDAEEDDPDAAGELENEDGKSAKPAPSGRNRNHKVKGKRFRLDPDQTRYLQSEFSRQNHPDAAHRERLAKAIPNISTRQIQVWFQNRRAKIKRMNAEDQKRTIESRRLPEGFDMTPSLHGAFGGPMAAGLTPGASPASYTPAGMHQSGLIRQLTLDTLRRGEIGASYGSPSGGTNPTMSSVVFTPPRSATDTMSPTSGSDISNFGFAQRPGMDSPRGVYRSAGHSALYSQAPRPLAGHERFRRASGGQASSPLRSSLSYDSMTSQGAQSQDQRAQVLQSPEAQGYISQHEGQRSMPVTSVPPYGATSFSYLNYPPNVRPPQPPSTADASMEMIQSYQREGQQILGQHAQAFPEYQNFHEAGQYPSPQVSQYGGQHPGQYPHQQASYTSSYMQRPDQPPVPIVHGQSARSHLSDPAVESEGESSTSRTHMSTSY